MELGRKSMAAGAEQDTADDEAGSETYGQDQGGGFRDAPAVTIAPAKWKASNNAHTRKSSGFDCSPGGKAAAQRPSGGQYTVTDGPPDEAPARPAGGVRFAPGPVEPQSAQVSYEVGDSFDIAGIPLSPAESEALAAGFQAKAAAAQRVEGPQSRCCTLSMLAFRPSDGGCRARFLFQY